MPEEDKTNQKDDEMAKKLMEELKAQGIDVDALEAGAAPAEMPKEDTPPEKPKDAEKKEEDKPVETEAKTEEKSEEQNPAAPEKTEQESKSENSENSTTEKEVQVNENQEGTEQSDTEKTVTTQEEPSIENKTTSESPQIENLAKHLDTQFKQEEQLLFTIKVHKYVVYAVGVLFGLGTVFAIVWMFI